jgi:hypothetical protein
MIEDPRMLCGTKKKKARVQNDIAGGEEYS